MNLTLFLWCEKRVKVFCWIKERNMVPKGNYNFLGVFKRVKDIDYFFDRTRSRSDRHTYLIRSALLQQVAIRIDRENAIPRSISSIERLVRRLYLVRVSSKLLITLRTQSFPWQGAHENIDKRRSNRGELVKGEEDICRSIDPTVGGREDTYKREDERRTMPRGGRKGGSARGTPAEQFCTRERAPRPKRGTPIVIIRGPSECFWPRWGSLKFRRHDLEKRSGGSPVIVFHHRRPPAPLLRNSLAPLTVSPPPTLYIGGGTDARTSIFQCPVQRMPLSFSSSFSFFEILCVRGIS